MDHELKTDPRVFQQVWDRNKKFEIRENDRNYQAQDNLILRETRFSGADMAVGSPLIYTGRSVLVTVTSILHGPVYGLLDGWCIMSVTLLELMVEVT